ncbi:hypothetical protein [Homoserinimonas sp. A520]
MSEYLTYTLWRQREERMPRELEHQRVAHERMLEQEQQLQELVVPTELEVRPSADEYVLVDE